MNEQLYGQKAGEENLGPLHLTSQQPSAAHTTNHYIINNLNIIEAPKPTNESLKVDFLNQKTPVSCR